jgi:hypothetical protein
MYQAIRTNTLYGYPFLKFQNKINYPMTVQQQKIKVNRQLSEISKTPEIQNEKFKNVNSPEIKINLNNKFNSTELNNECKNVNNKNINQKLHTQCSMDDLKTAASISNESLISGLSESSSTINFNNLKNNKDNFIVSPMTQTFLMNNNNNSNNNIITNSYNNLNEINELCNNNVINHQKKISMNNLSSLNLFSPNINYNNNNGNPIQRSASNKFNSSKKSSKNFYNKFNSPKDTSSSNKNENTVILTLRIKIAKNDYRVFNLKKYDDLFMSLQKFFELNQIKQELVKPIVTKIFFTLNKIFWLLNSKIGIYDQEYLSSLYKLWMKDKDKIPNTSKNNNNNKDLNTSKESTNSSESNSSISMNKCKTKLSKSYQDENSMDNSRQDTAKSF